MGTSRLRFQVAPEVPEDLAGKRESQSDCSTAQSKKLQEHDCDKSRASSCKLVYKASCP